MSKLQALSGRVDWYQRPYMINEASIEHILVANQNRDMIKRAKGTQRSKAKRFWTGRRLQNLCLWVAFAAAFTGIAFVTASAIANYQAQRSKVSEVWTADKNGNFIPMKHKGEDK